LWPGPGLLRARLFAPGPHDGAHRLEPRLVCDPVRGQPAGAGVPEVGAQGLLGTADQVVLLGGGQVEDGPGQPAPRTEPVPEPPGVRVGLPDPEVGDGQLPDGGKDPEYGRAPGHAPEHDRGPWVERQAPCPIAGSEELPAAVAQL